MKAYIDPTPNPTPTLALTNPNPDPHPGLRPFARLRRAIWIAMSEKMCGPHKKT